MLDKGSETCYYKYMREITLSSTFIPLRWDASSLTRNGAFIL